MADALSLTLEKSILWKIRLLPKPGHTRSPGFLVQDSEWHLELHRFEGRLNNSTYCYAVSLNKANAEAIDKLENCFKVSTFIQKDDHILLPSDETQIVERAYRIIAQFHESDIEEHLPGIKYDEDIFIVCRFHLSASDVSLQNEKHDNLDSLSQDLSKLLEDKVTPDVHLRCGDRTVAAHKTILAAKSPVFAAMFQSKMLEKQTGVVDITDVDAAVLKIFVKYVYSGKLSDVSDEDLPRLYAAGDKYDVTALKRECSERMINRLSRENCLNAFLLADAHSDQDFKNVTLDFIINQEEILKSEEWMKFRQENPSLAYEVYDLVVQRK